MGVVRRQRRNWPEVLESQRSSGLSVGAYCHKHGINVGLFNRWRRRLSSVAAPVEASRFIELHSCGNASVSGCVTLVSAGGWRVEVLPGFDAPTLQQVCACVQEAEAC